MKHHEPQTRVDLAQRALADARDEGFDARIADKPISVCPYEFGSLTRKRWLDGWGEADQQLHMLKQKGK